MAGKSEFEIEMDLRFNEFKYAVGGAVDQALHEIAIEVSRDSKRGSPVLTGNNRRSIAEHTPKSKPMGDKSSEGIEVKEDEAAVYSTSGYGGYLEVGSEGRAPRPYLKPAQDRHFTPQNMATKIRENVVGF